MFLLIRKVRPILALWVFGILSLPLAVNASHIMAGDLTYRCLGGNQYEVTLKAYRDCSGINMGSSVQVKLSSSCSADTSLTLDLLPGSGNALPLLCNAEQANSSCNGGTLLGVREFAFVDTVTLPMACSDWTFSWSSCCRNAAITNLQSPSSRSFYLEATLDNVAAPCNSSPVFSAIPTPYICLNQPFFYTQGTGEIDGDSLVYSLADPLENQTDSIAHVSGFSSANPLSPSVSFDEVTGQLSVTPNQLQVSVVAILVKEYRNGVLIGTTRRDLQIIVLNCNNIFPLLDPAQVLNLSSNASQTGPTTVELCPGNLLTFDLKATDANMGDSVFMRILNGLPAGALFTPTDGLDSASASFSWIPTPVDVGTHLLELIVQDNHCPLVGVQRYSLLITVLDRTSAGPDLAYCPAGGPVQLQAVGGASFTWVYLGGGTPPMSELSCSNCAAPLASPAVTTTYVVTSDLMNCIHQDTVTVTVVPDFTLTLGLADSVICRGDTTVLMVNAMPPAAYSYAWTPSATLSDPTQSGSFAYPLSTTRYHLTVEAPSGCVIADSIDLEVIQLTLAAGVRQDKVCRFSQTEILAQIEANSPYTTTWKDPLGAIISMQDTATITPLLNGYYQVQVADTGGICGVIDSVNIDVLDLSTIPVSVSVCPGDSQQLVATYLGPSGLQLPDRCGIGGECCGVDGYHQVGDTCAGAVPPAGSQCRDIVTTTAPYRSHVEAARLQYLFRQSELNAEGFFGGTIEALLFHVSDIFSQGPDSGIQTLTIKMGCTTEDTLSSFIDGLATVWGPMTFLPVTGFNTHTLDQAYDWDGMSNLVIEICSNDGSGIFGFASYVVSGQTATFPSVLYSQSTMAVNPCELQTPTMSMQRPTLGLNVCTEGIAPRYSWAPTIGLSNPTIANPKAAPPTDTTYVVTVTVADGCLCQMTDTVRLRLDGCILEVGGFDWEIGEWEGKSVLQWEWHGNQQPMTLEIHGQEGIMHTSFYPEGFLPDSSYRWMHEKPLSGWNHYQLRGLGLDGQLTVSSWKSVWVEDVGDWEIAPNPVKAGMPLSITLPSSIDGEVLELITSNGQVVWGKRVDTSAGTALLVQTPHLPPGLYGLRVGSYLKFIMIY